MESSAEARVEYRPPKITFPWCLNDMENVSEYSGKKCTSEKGDIVAPW
jgi:hypothetical protein